MIELLSTWQDTFYDFFHTNSSHQGRIFRLYYLVALDRKKVSKFYPEPNAPTETFGLALQREVQRNLPIEQVLHEKLISFSLSIEASRKQVERIRRLLLDLVWKNKIWLSKQATHLWVIITHG